MNVEIELLEEVAFQNTLDYLKKSFPLVNKMLSLMK